MGILGFARKIGSDRLNMACQRASEYGSFGYGAIRGIIERGLDLAGADESAPAAFRTMTISVVAHTMMTNTLMTRTPDNTINPEEQP
ncbi:MAG: hypothetical protein IPP80_13760 [Ignavibacteria bacterium]|nr:hypothetical protein [Ignavibacteria bacterium]